MMPRPHLGPPLHPLLLTISSLSLLPSPASAHGYISHPPARAAGSSTLAACGKPVTSAIQRDNTSHVEGLPELAARAGSGFDAAVCNLWLCRGVQFPAAPDDTSTTQTWRAAQVVRVEVKITIPHDGSANVSIVDAAANEVVGDMLAVWPRGYANERDFFAGSMPANQTEFDVTMPDLGGRCAVAGECVSFLAPTTPPVFGRGWEEGEQR